LYFIIDSFTVFCVPLYFELLNCNSRCVCHRDLSLKTLFDMTKRFMCLSGIYVKRGSNYCAIILAPCELNWLAPCQNNFTLLTSRLTNLSNCRWIILRRAIRAAIAVCTVQCCNCDAFCFVELEAMEACEWLREAGFPQYAQLYRSNGTCICFQRRQRRVFVFFNRVAQKVSHYQIMN